MSDFAKKAQVIHIDIDPSCISRNIQVDIPIVGHVKNVLETLIPLVKKCNCQEWLDTITKWKKEHPLQYSEKSDFLKTTKGHSRSVSSHERRCDCRH